jgi:hypothetical protein
VYMSSATGAAYRINQVESWRNVSPVKKPVIYFLHGSVDGPEELVLAQMLIIFRVLNEIVWSVLSKGFRLTKLINIPLKVVLKLPHIVCDQGPRFHLLFCDFPESLLVSLCSIATYRQAAPANAHSNIECT